MGSAAEFLLAELRHARVSRGLSQEDFGKLINYSNSHVSGVETGARPPKVDYLDAIDKALGTGGLYRRLYDNVVSLDSAPVWFQDWIRVERQATSLRWYGTSWIPGLFQTEAYARATLAGEPLPVEQVDKLVTARLGRQSILSQERPPLIVAVLEERIVTTMAENMASYMPEQLDRLAACAELPNVQVHLVPGSAGMHPGFGGPFILAETVDGERIVHADSQLPARISSKPEIVATLAVRWERIRGEALSRKQSLDLIKEAANSWS